MHHRLTRRDFLSSGLVAIGAALAGPTLWRTALVAPAAAAPALPGPGPYGPLRPPDANGISLPDGFTSRVVAKSGEPVLPAGYPWHPYPDGGATFPTDDGWIYVSNSEAGGRGGGAGSIRFLDDGEIVAAFAILTGTTRNCAGGPTPWGTWLSCEEHSSGRVWECDPTGESEAVVRPAMGVFMHEAAAVDPDHRTVYLTEDDPDGRFYRFVPDTYPDLVSGTLQVAEVRDLRAVLRGGATEVLWRDVPDPSAREAPTRFQVASSTAFAGGEGAWFDDGVVYFTTKFDGRVWAYDTRRSALELLYDDSVRGAPLTGVDNVTVAAASGDVLVAEDGGDLDIVLITPQREVARLVKVTGRAHRGSELAGPALSPDGDRLYFSSQRGFGRGVTFEIRGPFRRTRDASPSPLPSDSPSKSASGSPSPAATPTRDPEPPAVDENGPSGGVATAAALAAGAAAAGAAALARQRRQRSENP